MRKGQVYGRKGVGCKLYEVVRIMKVESDYVIVKPMWHSVITSHHGLRAIYRSDFDKQFFRVTHKDLENSGLVYEYRDAVVKIQHGW